MSQSVGVELASLHDYVMETLYRVRVDAGQSFFMFAGMTPTLRNTSCVDVYIVPPTPNVNIPSLVSKPCNSNASKRVLCYSFFF